MDKLPGLEIVKVGTKTPRLKVVLAVWVPDVPVMVTVDCPRVAELLAVSVNVLLPVVGLGVKAAVTPLGSPDAVRVTPPLKPYSEYTETQVELVVPCPMVTLPGPESEKVGTKTPKVKVVDLVSVPEVPVMVTVDCPRGAVLLTLSVSVLFPVVGLGEKDAVTPAGRPDADKLTLPLKPY